MCPRPCVSVIIPTYHRDKSLYRALESVALQTYKNCEVVVVDDNADEKWNSIVAKYITEIKNKYPEFQIVVVKNATNKGSAVTRNVGIQTSSGEYITFLDDDDIYLPEKIEKQLEEIRAANADYSITDLKLYDATEKVIQNRIRSYIKTTDQDSLLRYHLLYHLTGTDTIMFRKIYLQQIGMFTPIDVGDEFYLMEKAILCGGKFCYSPHCFVKAYVHTGVEEGLSSGQAKLQGENALYEKKKAYFHKLSATDIRYIKVRHHMVIAFAQYRGKHYISLITHMVRALFLSPIDTLKIMLGKV